ncbi:hypothetical protein GCM10027155_03180 [Acinetobacter apis]|uniref:MAE-28990/MAE-18760-like HEPN domain-containing protein n=1 Tax=Acinetobacter apis TaxID=1229165 RepID=A0A217ED44_9GAMM|nr:hypothetical protein [Acinetobacter apis]SNQ28403.1 hypothetical protein SAMN05444584_0323 [Acinetobacter apis]
MNKDSLESFIQNIKEDNEKKLFFAQHQLGAEVHWFFIEAVQAMEKNLILLACLGFINGIEASLRSTVAAIENTSIDSNTILNNKLLRKAKKHGLPINYLTFPGEQNFELKLERNNDHVEIVRLRHNFCHGNILEYVNKDLSFFTPECCNHIVNILLDISKKWVEHLGIFKINKVNNKE